MWAKVRNVDLVLWEQSSFLAVGGSNEEGREERAVSMRKRSEIQTLPRILSVSAKTTRCCNSGQAAT